MENLKKNRNVRFIVTENNNVRFIVTENTNKTSFKF